MTNRKYPFLFFIPLLSLTYINVKTEIVIFKASFFLDMRSNYEFVNSIQPLRSATFWLFKQKYIFNRLHLHNSIFLTTGRRNFLCICEIIRNYNCNFTNLETMPRHFGYPIYQLLSKTNWTISYFHYSYFLQCVCCYVKFSLNNN